MCPISGNGISLVAVARETSCNFCDTFDFYYVSIVIITATAKSTKRPTPLGETSSRHLTG